MNSILRRAWAIINFIGFYAYDLTISALKIALDVITPQDLSKPGIVAIPLDAKSDLEITTVANLISFSPGTMVVDLSPDRKTLYVHTMFLENEEQTINEIKTNLESRVLKIWR